MTKVAYNSCHGGFSLSRAAVILARKLSGDQKWANATLAGEMYDDGSGPCKDDSWGVHLPYEFPRTDPTLIKVIEQLGDGANGKFASLKIADVTPGTKYRIDEYDGAESVMTVTDYDWQTA